MAAQGTALGGRFQLIPATAKKGCFCICNENLPSLCGALALAWLDESGKDMCVGSAVLGVIVLSPALVLSPLPLLWSCSPSV